MIICGAKHTIRDFCQAAFSYLNLDYKKYVAQDKALAKKLLGWKPKTTFKELVQLMVDAELARLK